MRTLRACAVFRIAGIAVVLLCLAGCGGRAGAPKRNNAEYGPLLVAVAEQGASAELRLYSPVDGRQRRVLASVPHRQDWGLRATVSPDGRSVAYVVLPRAARDPDTEAEVWTLRMDTGAARRLATGVDARSDLVWSPDSAWVSYDKVDEAAIDLRRVNTAGAGDQRLLRAPLDDRWYLMGYAADGRGVVLAHVTAAGTEVSEAAPGDPPRGRTPVAPAAARGFTVSPEGRPALLVFANEGGRLVYRALARTDAGGYARLTAGGGEDTGIAWNAHTGRAAVGVVPTTPGQAVAATGDADTIVPPAGFDVPVAWSADGAYLALRHFTGSATDQPGSESIVVLGGERRQPVESADPLSIAGWTSG